MILDLAETVLALVAALYAFAFAGWVLDVWDAVRRWWRALAAR